MLKIASVLFVLFCIFNPSAFAQENKCSDLFDRAVELRAKQPRMPDGFQTRLKDVMSEKRITQADLSRILKFNGNSKISKVILGFQLMVLHDVVISASVLGVRTWWLLTGEGEKYLPSHLVEPSLFLSEYNKEDFIKVFKTDFGIQLKIAIAASGTTGISLANALNYDDAKISKVVVGAQEFMPDTAVEALRLIDVDPSYLLDFPLPKETPSRPIRFADDDILAAKQAAQMEALMKADASLLIEALKAQGWHFHTLFDPTTDAPGMIIQVTR